VSVGECALCGDAKHETAWVTTLEAEICLRCYEAEAGHRPRLDHLHGCPSCGQPGGGRYGSERICWPCWSSRHPELAAAPKQPRRKPDAYARLVQRVWSRLEAGGTVFAFPGHLAGYCPACKVGTVSVQVLDTDPPVIDVNGCSGGCTDRDVARALA
jgi:hypothetical protein